MTTERMSGPDAAWLHMDRPDNLMIVNTVLWFDTTPDWDRVEEAVQRRLVDCHRRFRQSVTDPPVTLGLVAPVWDEGAAVSAAAHIVRAALPAPGDARSLHAYIAEQARQPLSRDRPLWEIHAIDGYGTGAALLLRTHHAIGDGSALVEVISGLTDSLVARRRSAAQPEGYRPNSGDPVGGVMADLQTLAKLSGRVVRRPAAARARLTGRKAMTWSEPVSVQRLKELGRPSGSTINDVVLAAIAAAWRSLSAPGESHRDVDVVVPIDLRPSGFAVDGGLGNQFGLAFVRLPITSASPVERLERVTSQMNDIKRSRESAIVLGALGVMGRVPAETQRAWNDAFVGDAVAVVTNVKGPTEPVALAGTQVAGMGLWVPSTGPIGIGVSVLSYAGQAVVALVVDEGLTAAAAGLGEALDVELDRLTSSG